MVDGAEALEFYRNLPNLTPVKRNACQLRHEGDNKTMHRSGRSRRSTLELFWRPLGDGCRYLAKTMCDDAANYIKKLSSEYAEGQTDWARCTNDILRYLLA